MSESVWMATMRNGAASVTEFQGQPIRQVVITGDAAAVAAAEAAIKTLMELVTGNERDGARAGGACGCGTISRSDNPADPRVDAHGTRAPRVLAGDCRWRLQGERGDRGPRPVLLGPGMTQQVLRVPTDKAGVVIGRGTDHPCCDRSRSCAHMHGTDRWCYSCVGARGPRL